MANNTEEIISGNFTVAAYDTDGRMIGITMIPDELLPGETINATISCAEGDVIAKLKGFVLDIDTHETLSPAWEKTRTAIGTG